MQKSARFAIAACVTHLLRFVVVFLFFSFFLYFLLFSCFFFFLCVCKPQAEQALLQQEEEREKERRSKEEEMLSSIERKQAARRQRLEQLHASEQQAASPEVSPLKHKRSFRQKLLAPFTRKEKGASTTPSPARSTRSSLVMRVTNKR